MSESRVENKQNIELQLTQHESSNDSPAHHFTEVVNEFTEVEDTGEMECSSGDTGSVEASEGIAVVFQSLVA